MSFGDYDPEDAWDIGDDKPTHIHNLWERIQDLDGGNTQVTVDDLEAIRQRIAYWHQRRGTLDTIATLHLDHLRDDIVTVDAQ